MLLPLSPHVNLIEQRIQPSSTAPARYLRSEYRDVKEEIPYMEEVGTSAASGVIQWEKNPE
jgi:hypothetical protein